MPSDAKKKKDAKKKEAAKQRGASGNKKIGDNINADDDDISTNGQESEKDIVNGVEKIDLNSISSRSVTGVLASHPQGRDIKITNLSLTYFGNELLTDSTLELNYGNRYGFIGKNGSGKTTLLHAISAKELPIPSHIDVYQLSNEIASSDKTAIQCVLEVDKEKLLLEKECEKLVHDNSDESHQRLLDIYERLDELDNSKAETQAGSMLHGLGFTKEMQTRPVKDFSGGWRMRVSLARALYLKPTLLLLDEPTNHLDLEACVWLEEELKKYKRILVIISHSQDFLNNVCTHTLHLEKKKLKLYGGNYDTFIRTRDELLENQSKRYNWEQAQIAHMKDYIARFGHGSAKLARQAQSKEKTLNKMVQSGLTDKVTTDKNLSFTFPSCEQLPPPVLQIQNVSFRYDDDKEWIYKNLELGMDLDTRIALVGPNGAGKSTFLKMLCSELQPTSGMIRKNSHLKFGRYHQHLHEYLDLDMTPLDYMMKCFPNIKEREDMRKIIGRYELSGKQQTCPIRNLSDGQRCRIIFAWLALQNPHFLLLDEPTNHLDMETIDSLADALNDFEGGIILVSHDFRLIGQVAKEIWMCQKQTITKWDGDILKYKNYLRKKVIKRLQLDA